MGVVLSLTFFKMFIELFLLNWTLWFKKFVINSKKRVLMWAKSIKLSSFCNSTLRQLNFFCKVLNVDLISAVVYKFQCGLCNEFYYGKSIRYLDKRSGEHIGVSPLTGKNVKLSNNSAICDHLLHCNFLPYFGNCSIFAQWNKKYLLENERKPANHERQTIT